MNWTMSCQALLVLTVFALVSSTHGASIKREDSDSAKLLSCGDPSEQLITISNFTLSPVPVVLPGIITLGLTTEVKQEIAAPISVDLSLEVYSFNQYQSIAGFSDLHIEDMCEQADSFQCPLPEGTYDIPETTINIPVQTLSPGDYHFTISVASNGTVVSCLELYLSFA